MKEGLFSKIKNGLKTKPGQMSFKQKCLLALPGPASVLGSIIIHNTLMKYYTDIIGINPKYIGWIYFIYNIWNAINDPLFGVAIDKMKYNEKRGKYVYLMRVTAPVMMLSVLGMIFSSPSWNEWVIFLVLLGELFFFDTAYTVYSVAYQSYFLIAAPTMEERVDIEVIRTYIGNVIGFLATLIPTLLLVGDGKRELIIPIFTGVVAINAILLVFALKGIKDKPEMYNNLPKQTEHTGIKEAWKEAISILKEKPFLTYLLFYITARGAIEYYFTPFLYFMDDVVKASGTVATIADVIPGLIMLALLPSISSLIKRIGSKNVILISYIPALIGFGSLHFIKEAWMSVISYTFIVLSLNMVQTAGVVVSGSLIDDDEMRTGVRKTGLVGGLFSLIATTLTSIQAVVFTNVLDKFGYVAGEAVQPDRAVLGVRIGAGLVPIVFALIGLIPLLFFPFNKEKEQELSHFSKEARAKEAGV